MVVAGAVAVGPAAGVVDLEGAADWGVVSRPLAVAVEAAVWARQEVAARAWGLTGLLVAHRGLSPGDAARADQVLARPVRPAPPNEGVPEADRVPAGAARRGPGGPMPMPLRQPPRVGPGVERAVPVVPMLSPPRGAPEQAAPQIPMPKRVPWLPRAVRGLPPERPAPPRPRAGMRLDRAPPRWRTVRRPGLLEPITFPMRASRRKAMLFARERPIAAIPATARPRSPIIRPLGTQPIWSPLRCTRTPATVLWPPA